MRPYWMRYFSTTGHGVLRYHLPIRRQRTTRDDALRRLLER